MTISKGAGIRIDGLAKRYAAIEIMSGLDLDFKPGSFTVILGPSGCGKSTLLRIIAGLESATGGRISIDGKQVERMAPKDRGCAMVFQNYALYPHMTVAANIGYGLKLAGMNRADRESRVAEIAAMLGLSELLRRKPSQLSGGQRQRVAIGRAIARSPQVLLFDEPLSNLDAKLRHEMRIELRRLHDEIGATSIFVTHDQAEAMALADKILVLNKGQIEQYAAPDEVYRLPATRFVAEFVGSPPINLLAATITAHGAQISGGAEIGLGSRLVAPGTSVVLGLRPEQVTLESEGVSGLRAQVLSSENMGSHLIVHCDLSGMRVMAVAPTGSRPLPGQMVTLGFTPDEVLVFDAASGVRIDGSVLNPEQAA